MDGTVVGAEAVVDTSTLTGEPLPVTLRAGMTVLSGTANAGAPFDVRADRPAADSAYAALVRLVERAQTERAPLVRMADRYAGVFLPVDAGHRRRRLGDQRRCGPRPRRRGRRDPVPAHPGGADRARLRALACGPGRGHRQGRRRDRGARTGADRPLRQDRHADDRHARGAGGRVRRWRRPGRGRCGSPRRWIGCRRTSSAPRSSPRRATRSCRSRRRSTCARTRGRASPGSLEGRRVAVGSAGFLRAEGYAADAVAGARARVTRGSGEAHVLVGVDGRLAGVIVMADDLRPEAGRHRRAAAGRGHPARGRGVRGPALGRGRASGASSASTASTPSSGRRTSSTSCAGCATTRSSAPS